MAETNEVTVAKSWIAYELGQDSVIQSKIGDNFFYGFADKDAGDFYIVFQFVTGSLTKKLGMRRQLARLLFDIKVYQKGRGNADFNTVVNRIEELFGYFANRIFQGFYFSSELDFPLDLPESDREKKGTWQCTGGSYRIAISEGAGSGSPSSPINQGISFDNYVQSVIDSISKIASQNLNGHRVVYQSSSTSVDYVDNQNLAHSQLVLGITKNAAISGASIEIQVSGEMTEPSWNWTVGELVFCGANGVLTQTANTTGFLQRVGVAIAPTVLKIEIEEPIYLN